MTKQASKLGRGDIIRKGTKVMVFSNAGKIIRREKNGSYYIEFSHRLVGRKPNHRLIPRARYMRRTVDPALITIISRPSFLATLQNY